MALKENDLTWFKPMWRRVAVAVFLTIWLGWELVYTQDMFWAFLVGAALAYVAYNFFYAFPRAGAEPVAPPAVTNAEDPIDPPTTKPDEDRL